MLAGVGGSAAPAVMLGCRMGAPRQLLRLQSSRPQAWGGGVGVGTRSQNCFFLGVDFGAGVSRVISGQASRPVFKGSGGRGLLETRPRG